MVDHGINKSIKIKRTKFTVIALIKKKVQINGRKSKLTQREEIFDRIYIIRNATTLQFLFSHTHTHHTVKYFNIECIINTQI